MSDREGRCEVDRSRTHSENMKGFISERADDVHEQRDLVDTHTATRPTD